MPVAGLARGVVPTQATGAPGAKRRAEHPDQDSDGRVGEKRDGYSGQGWHPAGAAQPTAGQSLNNPDLHFLGTAGNAPRPNGPSHLPRRLARR